MLQIAEQELRNVVRVHRAPHARGHAGDDLLGRGDVVILSGFVRDLRKQGRSGLRADFDEEDMPSVRDDLGQGEVEAARPVRMEVQKQVPPASPQLTATMNEPSRRAR